jgi:ABC-type methionine transport system permease subunit
MDAADVPVFHDASGRAAVPSALVSLLGYSAMVGAVGGGLGDLGIRYCY